MSWKFGDMVQSIEIETNVSVNTPVQFVKLDYADLETVLDVAIGFNVEEINSCDVLGLIEIPY